MNDQIVLIRHSFASVHSPLDHLALDGVVKLLERGAGTHGSGMERLFGVGILLGVAIVVLSRVLESF